MVSAMHMWLASGQSGTGFGGIGKLRGHMTDISFFLWLFLTYISQVKGGIIQSVVHPTHE